MSNKLSNSQRQLEEIDGYECRPAWACFSFVFRKLRFRAKVKGFVYMAGII